MSDKTNPRIIVVDDDPEIQTLLRTLYEAENYEITPFLTASEALAALKKTTKSQAPDLIVCDLVLPDISGIEFIERLRADGNDTPVILITANATIETAAEALKKGAFDYIAKPINFTELSVISGRAIKLRRMEIEHQLLQEKVQRATSFGDLYGKSSKMQKVFELIERVANSATNVLITGESGTGKEMVARAIHRKSPRAKKSFIAINCSAIPDTLLESELFGHRKGAFTGANEDRRGLFEEANGGTILLDEIGDMPMGLQSKLLRVIQERLIKPVGDNRPREIDVRVIAATHKDLRKAVQDNTFREDLYYRLCVFPIQLPPLRERREDIPLLAEQFLKKFCQLNKVPEKVFTKTALSKLLRIRWNGNVRELENTIERAVLLADKDVIDDFHIQVEGSSNTDQLIETIFSGLPSLTQLEKEYIQYVLSETHGKKEAAAEILGINRKTLYRKEREFGI